MPKRVTVPPGADPSVPAELGGAGFEAIARRDGWSDGRTISASDLALMVDTNARKGGELRTMISDFPAALRTMGADAKTGTTSLICALVYESLISVNPLNLEFMPALASHWRVDPRDSQTYWFRINPDARYSDGTPVTTEDVLETWRIGADTSIRDPFQNTFRAEFEPPVAVSTYILKVRSRRNNWKNMVYFGGMLVYPAHALRGLTGADFLSRYQVEMPPGSGPYVVLPGGLKKQHSITLTRVADWWQEDDALSRGSANFNRITMLYVAGADLQRSRFLNGDADVVSVNATSWALEYDIDQVERGLIEKRKIWNSQPAGLMGIAFNMRREPFNDARVRQALIHLLDRELISRRVLFNEQLIADSYFENSPYRHPSNPRYRYDPRKAMELLAQAGYSSRNAEGILVRNGRPFVIEMPTDAGTEAILTMFRISLRAAGIELRLIPVEFSEKLRRIDARQFDLALASYTGIMYPNPFGMWHSSLADAPNSNNVAGFKNSRVDAIIMEEQVTQVPARRVRLLQELDSILMAENPYALLWFSPSTRLAAWKYIRAPKFGLGRISDARGIYSLWWYDPEVKEDVDEAQQDTSVRLPVPPVDITFWRDWEKAREE